MQGDPGPAMGVSPSRPPPAAGAGGDAGDAPPPPPWRSITSGRGPAVLAVRNGTPVPLRITWHDYRGAPRAYCTLAPGAAYRQHTYLTHPWTWAPAAPGADEFEDGEGEDGGEGDGEGNGDDDDDDEEEDGGEDDGGGEGEAPPSPPPPLLPAAAGEAYVTAEGAQAVAFAVPGGDTAVTIVRARLREWSPEAHGRHWPAGFKREAAALVRAWHSARRGAARRGGAGLGALPAELVQAIVALAAPPVPAVERPPLPAGAAAADYTARELRELFQPLPEEEEEAGSAAAEEPAARAAGAPAAP